mgnify:CR=1 FL=1
MEQIVKARKKHKCSGCQSEINIGDEYVLSKFRVPRYDGDCESTQVGVEFLMFKECKLCKESRLKEVEEIEEYMKKYENGTN